MKNLNTTRREFLGAASLAALGVSLPGTVRAANPLPANAGSRLVFLGTYTKGRSEGIYVCRLDLFSGELRQVAVAKGVTNPSFLAIDPRRQFLYAVNEVSTFADKPSGAVSSFSIDPRTGALQFLNQQPSGGSGPCHLTVDATNKFLLVANYDAGSVAVLPVKNGRLQAPVTVVQHHGASVNPERQQGPHAHGVLLDKANRHLFVPDLGLDKIMIYEFDARRGKLTAGRESWFQLPPGAGPRHFTIHPNGRRGYVINELNSTITACAYDPALGTLKQKQTVSTLPADFSGPNSCAEIVVAPSGRFVYGSNRGHDSIAVFSLAEHTGRLDPVQHVATQGKTPRSFAIDPAGDFLLAANQNSDNVVTYRLDRLSGKLSPTGHALEIPTPVCVVMSDKL